MTMVASRSASPVVLHRARHRLICHDNVDVGHRYGERVDVVNVVRCPRVLTVAVQLGLERYRDIEAGQSVERRPHVVGTREDVSERNSTIVEPRSKVSKSSNASSRAEIASRIRPRRQ